MALSHGKTPDDLDPIDINRLDPHYRDILIALHQRDLMPVIIGGVAVALLGGERLTRDLDAVSRDLDQTLDLLYLHGFRVVSRAVTTEPGLWAVFGAAATAAQAIRGSASKVFRTVHSVNGLLLDIWLEPTGVTKELLFARARKITLSSVSVLCASEEDLIAMKEAALTDNPARRSKDEQDIEFLRARLRNKNL